MANKKALSTYLSNQRLLRAIALLLFLTVFAVCSYGLYGVKQDLTQLDGEVQKSLASLKEIEVTTWETPALLNDKLNASAASRQIASKVHELDAAIDRDQKRLTLLRDSIYKLIGQREYLAMNAGDKSDEFVFAAGRGDNHPDSNNNILITANQKMKMYVAVFLLTVLLAYLFTSFSLQRDRTIQARSLDARSSSAAFTKENIATDRSYLYSIAFIILLSIMLIII